MSSKAGDGPTASSFANPRKTGWLYKHGGSGMSSHWRKRWFIVDHHYLFYYKGPNDKKPVGILCLPDYDSCHKADSKEWKKPHSFILDKGNALPDQDNTEAHIKNYVLYSDTEEDMREWINAISEEIKPVLGGKGVANGHPPTRLGRRKDEAKVDQKAFDELTKSAHEGPKLTHLTAQRPRVKGRRPPQRYATYHEDDTKEETPPGTPPEHRKTTPEIPSPSNSPSTTRKGHHPTVPLRPKPRTEITTKPLEDHEAVETVAKPEDRMSPGTKKSPRPPPPKKPQKEPSDVALAVPPTPPHEGSKSPEPSEPTPSLRPSTIRPIPPKKPPKDEAPPTPVKEVEQKPVTGNEVNNAPLGGGSRPVPPRKPRPQLPTKSRTSTTALEMPSPTVSPMEPSKRPVPVPRKRTRTAPDTRVEAPREQMANEAEVEKEGLKPKVEEHLPAVEEVSESVLETETKGEEESEPVLSAPSESDRTEASQSEEKEEEAPIYENVDVEDKEESDKLAGETPGKEPIEEPPKAEDAKEEELEVARTPPPDGTSNMNRPTVGEELSETGGVVDSEEKTKASEPQQEAKVGEGVFIDSAGYEKMEPIESIRISPEYGDYEPMNEGVLIQLRSMKGLESNAAVGTGHEYDEPMEWRPSSGESEGPPLPPQYNESAIGAPSKAVYDIPPPSKPAIDAVGTYDVPKSMTNSASTSPVPSSTEAGEEGQRSGLQSSSGSTSSARSDHKRRSEVTAEGVTIDLAVAAVIGKEGEWQAGRETVNKSPTNNSALQKPKWKLDRDALGYTRVNKPRTNDEGPASLSSNDMDMDDWHVVEMEGEQGTQTSLDLIPSTLKQAREILRLARVVKAEAEQIKQEAQRELDLARTERRDAELLKRNASGILKMAKEKLQSASK